MPVRGLWFPFPSPKPRSARHKGAGLRPASALGTGGSVVARPSADVEAMAPANRLMVPGPRQVESAPRGSDGQGGSPTSVWYSAGQLLWLTALGLHLVPSVSILAAQHKRK
jgi:hypothetical protein